MPCSTRAGLAGAVPAFSDRSCAAGGRSTLSPMRLLQLVHGFAPEFVGGTERFVQDLCLSLQERGHQVSVLAGSGKLSTRGPRIDRTEVGSLEVYRLSRFERPIDHWFASDSPGAARIIGRMVKDLRPDLVHLHHWKRLSRSAVRICRGLGVPVVVTLHDLWASCPRAYRLKGPGGDEFCELPLSVS